MDLAFCTAAAEFKQGICVLYFSEKRSRNRIVEDSKEDQGSVEAFLDLLSSRFHGKIPDPGR
jgi:hypothetical protein